MSKKEAVSHGVNEQTNDSWSEQANERANEQTNKESAKVSATDAHHSPFLFSWTATFATKELKDRSKQLATQTHHPRPWNPVSQEITNRKQMADQNIWITLVEELYLRTANGQVSVEMLVSSGVLSPPLYGIRRTRQSNHSNDGYEKSFF
jgi:hypothetical protein